MNSQWCLGELYLSVNMIINQLYLHVQMMNNQWYTVHK